MRFSAWLRHSNEAAPFRIAFDLTDQMPSDFGLKASCHEAIRARAEAAFADTKRQLLGGD